MFRSIRTKLVIIYLLLILFALQLIGAYFVRSLSGTLIANDQADLLSQTQLLATVVSPELNPANHREDAHSLLNALPQLWDGVVYVLDADGVVRDTTAGGALLGQKRVDSIAAHTLLHHTSATAVHLDPATHQHLLAAAVPVYVQRQFVGLVENVVPIQTTYTAIQQVTTLFYT
ncbi:MAG: cell wall metabolism sensor histidine kinase WalK, partial [Alicyclobacillus sp.]|nr:cell wall metabolism sensor histidine kinase WalK [Alicyclobacillus sp.]